MAEITKFEKRGNRHPVDELAEVREQMSRLRMRETELRELIISKRCDRHGDDYTAHVNTRTSERLDSKLAIREFGLERLRPFMKTTETIVVMVKRNG